MTLRRRFFLTVCALLVSGAWVSGQVPASALTAAALAGKTLNLTIEGGEAPFVIAGSYTISLSAAGGFYSQPAAGAVTATAGAWSHQPGAPIADAVLTLGNYFADGAPATLSLLDSGFFELNRAAMRSHQYGHFTLSDGGAVPPGNPPVITAQPAPQSVELGTTAAFSVSVQTPAGVVYQWRKDGVDIPGATGSSLTLASVKAADQGNYSVVVATPGGAAASTAAALGINAQTPKITVQPLAVSAFTGGTAVFSVTATGFPEPAYQWKFAGVDITGATSAVYQRAGITGNDAGNYTCVVTNASDAVTSDPGILTVIPQPGTVDTAFRNVANAALNNGAATSLLPLPDGKILVGGGFSQLDYTGTRPGIFRLNADGTLDPAFNTELTPRVTAGITRVAAAPDGKIYIAGSFTSIGAVTQRRLARLNADGSLDPAFAGLGPNDYTPADIAVQRDGKVLVAGEFPVTGSLISRKIARFHPDGTPDPAFDPGNALQIPEAVNKITLGADGRIYIAGKFITVAGVSRPRIAALTSGGALDPGFSPGLGFDAEIKTLLFQPDGRLLAGGSQTAYNSHPARCLTRLFSDGTWDPSFVPAPLTAVTQPGVYTLALQPDGKIVAGGAFTKMGEISRSCLTRLLPDGAADPLFNPGTGTGVTNPFVYDVTVQPGGGLIVAGNFTEFAGRTQDKLTRLAGDATTPRAPVIITQPVSRNAHAGDPMAFTVLADASPLSFQWAKNGVDLAGEVFPGLSRRALTADDAGRYTVRVFNAYGSVTSTPAVLTVDTSLVPGTLNAVFAPPAAILPSVSAVLPLDDGRLLIGGGYSSALTTGLARVNADGSRDATFTTKTAGAVNAVLKQPDGKLMIAGNFEKVDGITKRMIARFNTDGTLDTSFDFYYNGTVYALAMQADGKILAGGYASGGYLARLNPDGSPDESFLLTRQPNQAVSGILLQPDGKMLVTGSFSSIAGVNRPGLARLNPDGTNDTTFPVTAAELGFTPNAVIALQSGGRRLMAGADGNLYRRKADDTADASFSHIPPDSSTRIVRMLVLPDDRILAVKFHSSITDGGQAYRLVRLDADGSVDSRFPVQSGANDQILALAGFASGRIAAGGNFTYLNSAYRPGVAILDAENPLAPVFTLQPLSRTGLPGSAVTLMALASGTPAPAYQWRFNGAEIPGATSASLIISPIAPSVTGTYTVTATSPEGSALSNAVTVGIARPPVISRQPVNVTAPAGTSVTFSVTAESAVQPVAYQWRKNGVPMTGHTAPSFVLGSLTETDAGDYDVIVSNPDGSVTSRVARLTLGGTGDSGYGSFITASGLDPAGGGASHADPDGDGLSNLFEFIAGSNPRLAEGRAVPMSKITPGSPAVFSYEFDRRRDFAAQGIVIEYSDSLALWHEAVSGQNGITVSSAVADAATDRVTVSFPATLNHRFLRVTAR